MIGATTFVVVVIAWASSEPEEVGAVVIGRVGVGDELPRNKRPLGEDKGGIGTVVAVAAPPRS